MGFLNLFKKKVNVDKWINKTEHIPIPNKREVKEEIRTKVVGVTFKNDNKTDRQYIISKCSLNERLILKHTPLKNYPNAIGVFRTNGEQLGNLKDELAEDLLDRGALDVEVYILGLTGGTKEKQTRGCNIVIKIF